MKKEIYFRVLREAKFLIETKSTIRETASHFSISKSTVHKDLHERLREINPRLYEKVEVIMQKHIDERHLKGGESTKQKYQNMK